MLDTISLSDYLESCIQMFCDVPLAHDVSFFVVRVRELNLSCVLVFTDVGCHVVILKAGDLKHLVACLFTATIDEEITKLLLKGATAQKENSFTTNSVVTQYY